MRNQLVDDPAVGPDLAVGAGLHPDAGHLDHGHLELLLPQPRHNGVERHGRRGLRGLEERRVRREEHVPGHHVLVVLVVQRVRRHDVLHHGVVSGGVGRALLPQRRGQRGVHVGRGRVEAAVSDEGRAVGAADGVRAGEHDEVVDAEPLVGEAGGELGEVEGRRWQELERLAGQGHPAVAAPRGHREVGPATAEDGAGVAAGEGDDVGAGDGARARGLERGLGVVDDLETTQAREVGRR